MPRSLAFYRDLPGFEIIHQAPLGDNCDWAWLKLGSAELMVHAMYEALDWAGEPRPARTAAHADTTLFGGAPDVDGVCAYLRSKGLSVGDPVVRDYGMKQLSLLDPDGYGICFQWPTT